MYSNWTLILLMAVSVSGLTSCNRNQEPKIQKVPDTWALSPVEIEIPGTDGKPAESRRIGRTSDSAAAVPVNASLFFPSIAKDMEDGKKIHVTIRYHCRLGGFTSITSQMELDNPIRISLREFIDHRLLVRWMNSPGENIECNLIGVAANEIGSTNEFQFKSLQIDSLTLLENLSVPEVIESASLEVFLGRLDQGTGTEPSAVDLHVTQGGMSFFCEWFETYQPIELKTPISSSVAQLIHGPPLHASKLAAVKDKADPRVLHTEQNCRVTVGRINDDGRSQVHWMTPIFKVQFPEPRIDLTIVNHLVDIYTDNFKDHGVFSIQVANPNPFPVAFKVTRFPSLIILNPVMKVEGGFVKGDSFDVPLAMEISGATQFNSGSISSGSIKGFEINPRQTARILFSLRTKMKCLIPPSDIDPPGRDGFIGFQYSGLTELRLERLTGWDPLFKDWEGPSRITPIKTLQGHGWLPHEKWLAVNGPEPTNVISSWKGITPALCAPHDRFFSAIHKRRPEFSTTKRWRELLRSTGVRNEWGVFARGKYFRNA